MNTDSTISHFDTEAEMVAAISRVVSTLPREIRDKLSFGNGETQVLQVIGADSRRNDAVFFYQNKAFGVEFKRGVLQPHHLYEALIERRYSIILQAQYGDQFEGVIFVGEQIDERVELSGESGILETLEEFARCRIVTQTIDEFARAIVTCAIRELAANPKAFSTYTLTHFCPQLHALTTKSDGYPEWFGEDWLKAAFRHFSRDVGSCT